jgi:hypothetical protein
MGTHWGQWYNRPTGCSADKVPHGTFLTKNFVSNVNLFTFTEVWKLPSSSIIFYSEYGGTVSSETSVTIYQTTRCLMPEQSSLYEHRNVTRKSHPSVNSSTAMFAKHFRAAVRNIAKSDYWFLHVCPSVRSSVWKKTRLQLDGFFKKFSI